MSSAEKNWVGGWEGKVERESCVKLVSVESMVERRVDGTYPIGMTLEPLVMVVEIDK